MPREIPFPDYNAGDHIKANEFHRLNVTVNNLTSQSSGPGMHSFRSSVGSFSKLENPTPFVYAKILKRVEVEETPFSEGSGSGSGSGTNKCPDSGSGSGSGSGGSGCQPSKEILYKYTWRQMFEQDGRLYDPVGDTQDFFPGFAGSADRLNEPQYYWPAYEINNREVDPDTIVQLYFGWGNWLYFNVGGHGVGGPGYIDVITNICPIFEEVEPAIGITRIDTANGIIGGPITSTGTIELEDTISEAGIKLSGISQGTQFQTSDGSLQIYVNTQGRITQIQQAVTRSVSRSSELNLRLSSSLPHAILELREDSWNILELRSPTLAATVETRTLDKGTRGTLSLSCPVYRSIENIGKLEVRWDPLKQIPILCYAPATQDDVDLKLFVDSRCLNQDWLVAPYPVSELEVLASVSREKERWSWEML